jgi:hypothetical protein
MGTEDDRSDERHVWMVRASNADPVGPVSIAQIAQAIAFGKLREADEVRHLQAASWEKVGPFMARMRAPSQAQVDATGQIPLDSTVTLPRVRAQVPTSPGIAVRRFQLGGLFDFTFTTFFTSRIVAVLYVGVLLTAVGYLLACETFGVTTIVGAVRASQELGETSAIPFVMGVALMLAGLVGAVVIVVCGRVALEFIVVTFRISETLTEIKARTK